EDRALPSTFTVTNLLDSGAGSLRAAVASANATVGSDTITFASTVRGTIILTSGQLALNDSVTITGPGASLLTVQRGTAAGTANFRIFNVAANKTVTISGLTIANGRTTQGGGILNAGILTLNNDVVTGNTAAA